MKKNYKNPDSRISELKPHQFFLSLLMVITLLLSGAITSCSPEVIPAEEDIHPVDRADIPDTPRELRAVWIATVSNIDWPSEPGLSAYEQKAELRAMFDRVEMLNMNAVIFQVRPATDALYKSDFEPWSEYLSGKQGQSPEPEYDPLEFAVEEARRRGLELHAWINPFRSKHPSAESELAENHLIHTKPDIVREYGRHLWMDPGHPESHEWSMKVIRDIVSRYDIDAMHIDDYFYPYRERDEDGNEIDFPDSATYHAYVAEHGEIDRNDWRRRNVDTFIERMHKEIKEVNPEVRFGVSPIGLWRPDYQGDDIEGFDDYESIYADSRKWFANGWLDYFTPQLYWPTEQEGQKYRVLVDWWHEQNEKDRHFWPGNFTNRIGYGEETWPVTEITDQIRITRDFPGTTGNVHFSMRVLMQNPENLVDSLMTLYEEPALVPATDWIDDEQPSSPRAELFRVHSKPKLDIRPAENEEAWLYVVKTRYGDEWKFDIIPAWKQQIALAPRKDGAGLSGVAVTAVNRLGVESDPVIISN